MKYASTLGVDEAKKLLQEVVAKNDYVPAYARLGRLFASAGDFANAEKTWLKGFKATGSLSLLLYIENSLRSRGKVEEMLTIYKKQARKSPGAALLRARLLISLGKFGEAASYVASLDSVVSKSPCGRWLTGEAFLGSGEYEKAARALKEGGGGTSEAPLAPFNCSNCGASSDRWLSECPSCHVQDSLHFDKSALMLR